MDWSSYYPAFAAPVSQPTEDAREGDEKSAAIRALAKDVTVADIGCGFGGLLVALAPKLPDELVLGKLRARSRPVDKV